MKHSLFRLPSVLGFGLLLLVQTVHADDEWPAREVGAAAAGFNEAGIEALDAAMAKIVADQAGLATVLLSANAPSNPKTPQAMKIPAIDRMTDTA